MNPTLLSSTTHIATLTLPLISMSTVTVTGLGPDSTKETIEAFFSFCGTIDDVKRDEKSAEIKFVTKAGADNAALYVDCLSYSHH